jgi:TonB family protein
MRRWLLAIAVIAMWCAPVRGDDVRAPDPASPPRPTGVVTRPPRLIQALAPDYPPAALEAGREAKVKVRIHIDATGTVSSVDVIEPVGEGFDEAAVAAAMQYVFEPAEIDGVAAAIVVETTINFVIEQRE